MRCARLVAVVLPAFLIFGMAGCSDDGPVDASDPPLGIPEPPNPVDIFFNAMEEFDITWLSNELHDDFQLQVLPSTFAKWAQVGNPLDSMVFDRQQTLAMLASIIDQEEGLDWNGSIVPPVASIEVAVMDQEGTWELVGDGVDYFGDFSGVYRARYTTFFRFKYPGSFWFEVIQSMDFYVIHIQDQEFKLLGIVPYEPEDKSVTDVLSLEDMLSLYR